MWLPLAKSTDVVALAAYRARFPDAIQAAAAFQRLAELHWRALSKSTDIAALKAFADRFFGLPEGKKAEARIAKLTQTGPSVPWKWIAGGAAAGIVALVMWQWGKPEPIIKAGTQPVKEVPATRQDAPQTTTKSPRLPDQAPPTRKPPQTRDILGQPLEEALRKASSIIRLDQNRAAAPLTASELTYVRGITEAKPDESFQECADCPRMVPVPPGEFAMGSGDGKAHLVKLDGSLGPVVPEEKDRDADEGPPHVVRIPASFAVGKFEVTFAEWEACVAGGGCQTTNMPSDAGWGKLTRPVINVSWNDAREYVCWLNDREANRPARSALACASNPGQRYRLLSEAEWEYSARGQMQTRYSSGDTISKSQAQFSADKTVEVGSSPANRFGLHDMHGNVWEWVQDCYVGNYTNAPKNGLTTPETQNCSRVLRGGSWNNGPQNLRSAFRNRIDAVNRYGFLGFRVARTF